MADPVKHVVSVLKTALDQIQSNINVIDIQRVRTLDLAPVLDHLLPVRLFQQHKLKAFKRLEKVTL